MKSLSVVFDGNYLVHKTFSVIRSYNPNAETADELFKDTKIKGVFLRKMIIDACAALNKIKAPIKQVIFVFDSTSWRYGIHPDYKHKLSKPREDDYTQVFEVMEKLIKKLHNVGFIVSRVDGMEGDDLLYFWAKALGIQDEDVLLITGDGDMHQLVNDNVSIFNNNSKNLNLYVSEPKDLIDSPDAKVNIVDAKKVVIKKILLGDGGDNVPSVKKGFGEKTFDKFYAQIGHVVFGDVDDMAHDLNTYLKRFLKTDEDFGTKIHLNIMLTYLDSCIYSDSQMESVLDNMNNLEYSYKEPKFTLEHIYGMMIK